MFFNVPKVTNCWIDIQMRKTLSVRVIKKDTEESKKKKRAKGIKSTVSHVLVSPPFRNGIFADGTVFRVLQTIAEMRSLYVLYTNNYNIHQKKIITTATATPPSSPADKTSMKIRSDNMQIERNAGLQLYFVHQLKWRLRTIYWDLEAFGSNPKHQCHLNTYINPTTAHGTKLTAVAGGIVVLVPLNITGKLQILTEFSRKRDRPWYSLDVFRYGMRVFPRNHERDDGCDGTDKEEISESCDGRWSLKFKCNVSEQQELSAYGRKECLLRIVTQVQWHPR